MESQNYSNHARFVKGYHLLLTALLTIGIIGAAINIYRHIGFEALLSCILIFWLFICAFLLFLFVRQFPLKAQDRSIRAEESLRYYILAGKPIDSRLTLSQIIALRFASDEEYLALAEKAALENLSSKEIKQAVKNWKADTHRV